MTQTISLRGPSYSGTVLAQHKIADCERASGSSIVIVRELEPTNFQRAKQRVLPLVVGA